MKPLGWPCFYPAGLQDSPTRGKFLAMPRGRHRHSPPLRTGCCLLRRSQASRSSAPWGRLFTEPTALRALAAAAAVTAVVGGVVMRRWDTAAGKRVADLTRARASDEWRHEERVAERDRPRRVARAAHQARAQAAREAGGAGGPAQRTRGPLRRYATAETERASALQGCRLLEIETVAPARALTAATETVESAKSADVGDAVDSVEPEALEGAAATDEDMNEGAGEDAVEDTDDGVTVDDVITVEAENASEEPTSAPSPPRRPSPAGSSLFLRADAALSRITHGDAGRPTSPTRTLNRTPIWTTMRSPAPIPKPRSKPRRPRTPRPMPPPPVPTGASPPRRVRRGGPAK